jgi:hypothetical protein
LEPFVDPLEPLGRHTFYEHVSELDLSGNKIRDTAQCITGAVFPGLRVLNLDNNQIADPSSLTGLSALVVLRLNHNRIDSIAPDKRQLLPGAEPVGLQTLAALEVLQLGYNDIHSLLPLRLLPLGALKVLFVQANDIAKLEGLDGLSQLRELVLDKNKVRHVEPGALQGLVNLRELRMEENGLKSLAHIGPLPRLHALHLGANRVADMNDLDRIAALPAVLDLTLANNPVARKQLYRATAIQKLPTLKILDNKEVSAEERDRVDILFSMETRATSYVGSAAPAGGAQSSISKVPIKMSSVTFDQLGGAVQVQQSHHLSIGGGGGGGHGGAAGGASFVCIGLSNKGDHGRSSDGEWHPFHNSTGDFFLPAGKTAARQRTQSGGAMGVTGASGDNGEQGLHGANWAAGGGDRRASPHRFPADRAGSRIPRPRSGDRPARAPVSAALREPALGGTSSAAAAAAARAATSGLGGAGVRSRKLGHLLGAQVSGVTPRGRHPSPMNGVGGLGR